MPTDPTLSLVLWDLRAQFEAQIRRLGKIQKWVDEFATLPSEQQGARHDEIVQNLTEIVNTSKLVGQVGTSAIALAPLPHPE
jgi:hypothetical protein